MASQIKVEVIRLEAAVARLRRIRPAGAFTALVATDATRLTNDASARLSIVTADLTAEHDTNSANLTAIETANPGNTQLATDVKDTIGPTTEATGTAFLSALTTALTTDIAAIVAAFPS